MDSDNGNYNFVRVQKGHMKQWRDLIKKQPLSAEIMFYFMEVMGKNTNAVVCSYKTLQEVTGYSRPSVGRAIKTLKDMNWIDKRKSRISNSLRCEQKELFGNQGRTNGNMQCLVQPSLHQESETRRRLEEKSNKIKSIPFIGRSEGVIIDNNELPLDKQELELE
ncbi:replication/maintenance protein RepL [Vibrio cyclitrophicus]